MRRGRAALCTAAVVAWLGFSCFSPSPPEGLPCSETGNCPPGQRCDLGICRATAALEDAAGQGSDGGAIDGGIAAFGEYCARDAECRPGLQCFLDGPGRNESGGFCTDTCSELLDCQELGTEAEVVCFGDVSATVRVCARRCTVSCPEPFDCYVTAMGGVCDLPLPKTGMDGGVTPMDGSPGGDAG